MACSLTVTSVTGIPATPGGTTTATIIVTGTLAGDCQPIVVSSGSFDVVVTVDCGAGPVTVPTRSVAGAWSVAVPITCSCGLDVTVTARCATNPDCSDSFSGLLYCDQVEAACPEIQWTGFTVGDCGPNGTRLVSVSALVTPAGFCTAELRAGTNVLASGSGSTPFPLSGSGNYTGAVNFSVVITAPPGCTGIMLPLVLPICAVCPDIVLDYDIGDCSEGNDRIVTVTVQATSTSAFTIELQKPLGTTLAVGSGGGPASPPLTLSYTGLYPGGTSQTFHVVVVNPASCGDSQIIIDLPGCNCPSVTFDPATVGDCKNGSRQVTVTAHLAPPASAELRDSSGVVASVSPGAILSHTGTYTSGTSETFTVVVTAPLGCRGADTTVSVPACGGGEGIGCLGLRIVIAVAGAIAILAALLALCIPPAATALFIAAAILAGLAVLAGFLSWLFGCKQPCNAPLLLGSQIALGAGLGALLFSLCCPWMIWVGLALAVAGLGGLVLWWVRCDTSWCALLKEITYVVGGVVLPIIGIITLIPLVNACINYAALAWVSAVFGPIAALAAACSL